MKEITNIHFFNAIEFTEMVVKMGPEKVLADKKTRELFYCHPFMMNEVLKRNKPMWIGKIEQEDHPFDVVFVEEDDLLQANQSNTKYLKDPLFIQLKEIRDDSITERIPVKEWFKILRERISKIKTVMEEQGVLHLHNKIHFELIEGKQFEELLKTLIFSKPFPYKQVTLSIELANIDSSGQGIKTWQIYPKFWPIGSISNQRDSARLRKIYGLDT